MLSAQFVHNLNTHNFPASKSDRSISGINSELIVPFSEAVLRFLRLATNITAECRRRMRVIRL